MPYRPAPNLAVFQFSFSPYNDFLIFITLSMTSPCVVQGAKLRTGPLKICKPAPRPTGFGENFSPKALHIFSPSVSAP